MAGRYKDRPFTFSNDRFHTNITKGFPHGPGRPLGSVLEMPLYERQDCSLWLEFLYDREGPGGWSPEPMWLMWYDGDGNPCVDDSAPIDAASLQTMISGLARHKLVRVGGLFAR